MTKNESKFENGKNLPKKEEICFRWELNSKPFIMAEMGNYLENKLKIEKSAKKEKFVFVERWTQNVL